MSRIVGMELRAGAFAAFCLNDPAEKVRATQALWTDKADIPIDVQARLQDPGVQPGPRWSTRKRWHGVRHSLRKVMPH